MSTIEETRPPRRLWRSVLAIIAGMVLIFGLSMAVDELAYRAGLFPRDGVTYAPIPYVIATIYRGAIGIAGAWLAARLAPSDPMRHALIIGLIGVVLTALGLIAALTRDMGPVWYPVALILITMPCAWLGGATAPGKA